VTPRWDGDDGRDLETQMHDKRVAALVSACTDPRYWDRLPKPIRDAVQPFLPNADDVRGILARAGHSEVVDYLRSNGASADLIAFAERHPW
jgi:hypothetical protein